MSEEETHYLHFSLLPSLFFFFFLPSAGIYFLGYLTTYQEAIWRQHRLKKRAGAGAGLRPGVVERGIVRTSQASPPPTGWFSNRKATAFPHPT